MEEEEGEVQKQKQNKAVPVGLKFRDISPLSILMAIQCHLLFYGLILN